MADELLIEQHGAVRLLRLNRPEKRNALNLALVTALIGAFADADRDVATRVVVLAANGPSFCAGGDKSETPNLDADGLVLRAARIAELFGTVAAMEKPVIAAAHGAALGGGAGLALSCDLTLLGTSAKLGYPEVRNGIAPAVVMPNLVRQVGPKAAFMLIATGDAVTADRALALGMANAVYPDASLVEEALALAARLADASPVAMALTKRLFYQASDATLAQGLELGRLANETMN